MKILNIFILMGCNCIRPQENNFLNLEVGKEKNKKNFLFDAHEIVIFLLSKYFYILDKKFNNKKK